MTHPHNVERHQAIPNDPAAMRHDFFAGPGHPAWCQPARSMSVSTSTSTKTMNGGRGMMVRKSAGRCLAILGASMSLVGGMVGCEHRNDDINRVQPGYVRKAIYEQDSEWYYRRTIAKSETTQSYIVEGHGDIPLDRVKFNIQEKIGRASCRERV